MGCIACGPATADDVQRRVDDNAPAVVHESDLPDQSQDLVTSAPHSSQRCGDADQQKWSVSQSQPQLPVHCIFSICDFCNCCVLIKMLLSEFQSTTYKLTTGDN